MSFLRSLLGIEETPAPELTINDKPKTDSAIPFLVGSDYVKLKGIPVFKRLNKRVNEVGLGLAWCTGPVPNANADADLYIGDKNGRSSQFRFNPGSEEYSKLAWVTPGGDPNGYTINWPDFQSRFLWTQDMKGKGIVYSLIKYARDAETFESDPSSNFWLKVKKGNCRATNGAANGLQDGWANNPFAVMQWYISDAIVGMGKPASMFGSSFLSAINWIENNPVTQDGVNKKRFTVNGFISTEKDFKSVLQIFEKHCHSRLSFIEGNFEIQTKGRVTTAFLDLNASNIDGGIDVKPASTKDSFSQFQASFINPDKNWEKDFAIYPATDSTEHLAALERVNYIENIGKEDLELCNNYFEAYEFARIKYLEAKERVDVNVTVQAEASQLVPYDVVSITDPKRGWNGELFLVDKKDEKDRNGVELYNLDLISYNPTIYEYSGNGSYVAAPVYDGSVAKLPAVEDLTWSNNLRSLSWDTPDTESQVVSYSVYVDDVFLSDTRSTSYQVLLGNGTYKIAIIPQGLFTAGESSILSIAVGPIVTPDYTPDVNPGFIVIKPPEFLGGVYNFRHNTVDDLATAKPATSDLDFTLFTNQAGSTRYFWVRTQIGEQFGNWVKKSAVTEAPDSFTWQIYADDASGTNPSDTDASKAFTGLAFFQSVPTPSLVDLTVYKTWLPNNSTQFISGSGAPPDTLGENGYSYQNTDNDDIYIKSPVGWIGPIGNFGNGDGDGFSSGNTNPNDADGNDGNTYLNLVTKELFKKISGVWVSQGLLRGQNGKSAYELWLEAGNSGPLQNFIDSLNAVDGVDGNTWHSVSEPPANNLGVRGDFALENGSIVHYKAGVNSWVFQEDLRGAAGKSAYELWLDLGNTGTEQDFLNDLNVNDGVDGNTWHAVSSGVPPSGLGRVGDFALSAGRYVYFKSANTFWQYIKDLQGPAGREGPVGPPGAAGQDAPGAFGDSANGAGAGLTNTAFIELMRVTVPSGLGLFTLEASVRVNSFAFRTVNGEPLDVGTRMEVIIANAANQNPLTSGSQTFPSSGFSTFGGSGTFSRTYGNAGAASYAVYARIAVNGTHDTRGFSWSGSMQTTRN